MAYYKSSSRWQKNNTTLQTIRLNNYADKDILKFLEKQENKNGFLKDLIRAEMERQNFVCPHPTKKEIAEYESYLEDLEEGIQEVGDYEKA